MILNIARAFGLLIIEVINSGPNQNPDAESEPRCRLNGRGEISPPSIKRKLRDLLEDVMGPVFKHIMEIPNLNPEEYKILESRGRNREQIRKEQESTDGNFLNSAFVQKYWDARVFGNTFLEEEKEGRDNKKTIRTGVVQFGMGLSIAPINIRSLTFTNKAGVQEGKNQGMGSLCYRVVEHAVYVMPFFITPTQAYKTGCTQKDIEVLKALIPYAYDHTRSAIRPDIRIRHAWYIEHKDALGSCADWKLIEALTPKKKGNPEEASTSWDDYEVPDQLPDELKAKISSCVDLVNL